SAQARAAPPAGYQGTPWRRRLASVQPLGAEVVMKRGTLTGEETYPGLFPPKLKVGRSCAPLGLEVKAAFSVTVPVKPPAGVTVIVEKFPVIAPGATVTTVPVIVKPKTVTEA